MRRANSAICILLLLLAAGCTRNRGGIPRPEGFLRIDRADTAWRPSTSDFPLTFEIPVSARETHPDRHLSWLNIAYPDYRATLWCSYLELTPQNRERLFRESRDLVYRHITRAADISAQAYADEALPKYALLYTLAGDAATPLQFVVTDSTTYLFRGALYFDTPVRPDSVAPVIGYISDDIRHLIETLTPRR